MKNSPFILPIALLVGLCISCSTKKVMQNEKAMGDWLSQAKIPITVQFQSNDFRCRPTLHCYTLVDANGQVYYAQNVRYQLPRVIPEDSTRLQRSWLEQLLGER